MEKKPVFVREATGLVREFSALDAFIVSSAIVIPSLWGFASQIGFVAGADPGADIVLSAHLGFLFNVPLAIVYYLLSRTMPRSGSEYVWVSRMINPVIGFMSGWALWLAILAGAGLVAGIFGSVILPVSLASFGYNMQNPSLVSLATALTAPNYIFGMGLILLVVGTLISAFGPKVFTRSMIILFILIMVSTFIAIGVLAVSSHADFVQAVNGYGGANVSYDGIIKQAQSTGWSFAPLTLSTTLLSVPLGIYLYNGQTYSAAVSGEIKTVKRSMLFGTLGALIFAWVIDIVGTQLSVNVIGYQFIQATTALGPSWPLASPPWLPLFISMLIHNNVLLFFLHLGWIVTFIWALGAELLVCTRYVFALSFDRVLPTRLADVSERFHNPTKAMATNFVVAAIFLAIGTYTSLIGLLLNAIAILTLVWFLASIVAIVLPYRRKDLAAGLPGANWKVPLITIVGALSSVLMLISVYYAFTTPAVGPSTLQADAVLAGIFLLGLAVYVTGYYRNKRKGIDLRLVYAEIPPE